MSESQISLPWTASPSEALARVSAWLESVRAWLTTDPGCSSKQYASLMSSLPVGLSLRTSLVCCLPSKAKISPYAWRDSQAGGQPSQKAGGATLGSPSDPVTVSRGACVTHSFSEWPSAAVVCSLSDVLEDSVPPKYFLSPKACSGILRRAERRGKRLPGQLTGALAARADNETT